MKITVLSQRLAEMYTPRSTSAVCISITITNGHRPTLSDRFADVLRLEFDDVPGPAPGRMAFRMDQAQQTLDFLDRHRTADELVCHCAMGASRSPAVAIAAAQWLNLSVLSELVVRFPEANPHVLRSMRSAIALRGGQERV